MNLRQLGIEVSKIEGKKVQVDLAQINEVIWATRVVIYNFFNSPETTEEDAEKFMRAFSAKPKSQKISKKRKK